MSFRRSGSDTSLTSAIAAVEHEIANMTHAHYRHEIPEPSSPPSTSSTQPHAGQRSGAAIYGYSSDDHHQQHFSAHVHPHASPTRHTYNAQFRRSNSDAMGTSGKQQNEETEPLFSAEPSSITEVISALMKQSRTIRKLQQAVNDLEAAKLQQQQILQQNFQPQSPGRWGEIKRSLAAKSSCAEVEELRAKVKDLEDRLLWGNPKRDFEFSGNYGGHESGSPQQKDSPLSPRDLLGDASIQEMIGKAVESIVTPLVMSVRSEIKSEVTSILEGAQTLTNNPVNGGVSSQSRQTGRASSDYGAIIEQLQRKYDNLSQSTGRQDNVQEDNGRRSPVRSKMASFSEHLGEPGRPAVMVSRPSSPHIPFASDSLHNRLESSLKRLEDLEEKMHKKEDSIRDNAESEASRRFDSIDDHIESIEKKSADDFKFLSEKINIIQHDVFTLQESEHQIRDGKKTSASALESVCAQISDMERAFHDENCATKSRLDALLRKQSQLETDLKEVDLSDRNLHNRLDLHVQSLENIRKQVNLSSSGGMVSDAGGVPRKHGESGVKSVLETQVELIKTHLNQKVDTSILEELMRHLATRDELRRIIDSISSLKGEIEVFEPKISERDFEAWKNDILEEVFPILTENLSKQRYELQSYIKEQMEKRYSAISSKGHSFAQLGGRSEDEVELKKITSNIRRGMTEQLNQRMSDLAQDLQTRLDRLRKDFVEQQRQPQPHQHLREEQMMTPPPKSRETFHEAGDTSTAFGLVQQVTDKISREFDEKLYLLCSDLSACKAAFNTAARQPFYRCGLWLWKSNSLVLGSAIPWNYETTNTDPDNFRWEQDQSFIRIVEAGLYEITFAFFTKCKPSIQLIINGESVLSAINSPTYVVHHSSGFVFSGDGHAEQGTVTGLSLIDYMALPAKSALALHYHGGRKGIVGQHGFLGLRKLL